MSLRIVPPREGLVVSVMACLHPKGKDYGGHWVVFPERRPGYYLRKALAAREGTAFLSPRIDSMDAFVDRVYRERLGRRDRSIDSLDAVAILLDIHRSESGRLGGGHFLTADQFFPLGTKIFRDLEEMAAASVKGEALTREDGWAEDGLPEATRRRIQSLSLFYERFYETLARRGFSTPGSRRRDVAAALEPELFEGFDRLILAGFFPAPGGETGIVKTMSSWPNVDILFQAGSGLAAALERSGMADPGLRAEAERIESEPVAASMEFFESPDAHGQVFALNAALAPALADPAALDERSVIVLPAAETLFPLHQQTLAALPGDAYNISLGYPLYRTPLAGFFDRLLELIQSTDEEGRVYAPHYLRFLLHPYVKNLYFYGDATNGGAGGGNWGREGREGRKGIGKSASRELNFDGGSAPGETGGGENRELRILPSFSCEKEGDSGSYPYFTRLMVHAVEDELRERRTRAFWGLDELESDAGIRAAAAERLRGIPGAPDPAAMMGQLARIHAALITPFQAIGDVGEFAAKLRAALLFIHDHGTARRHVFFHPYAEAFRDRLEALGRSLLGPVAFEDKSGYFALFRKVIAAGSVPFEGTPLRGLQVLGFWETRGLPFRDVSILDLDEDVLPAARRADSLLPFAARRALGLPTYKDVERRAGYYLDALLRGADRIRAFCVKSKDRVPSRFFAALLWERQKRAGEPRAARLVGKVQYRIDLQAPPLRPVPKDPETAVFLGGLAFSATSLDMYLRCPLQFHRRYVLGLKERDEPGEEPEAKDIGSFVHSVLEEHFGPAVGRPLRAADLNPAALDALLERRFADAFGAEASGGLYLLKRQVRTHLREFLTGYQAAILAGLEAEGQELRILGLERKFDLEWEGRRLTAAVDRLEARGGELHVLDYKTSGRADRQGIDFDRLDLSDRASWPRRIGSLQLPFYHLILSRAPLPPPFSLEAGGRRDVRCALVLLGKPRLHPGIEFEAFSGGRELKKLDEIFRSAKSSTEEKAAAREGRNRLLAGRIALTEALIGRLLAEIADPARPFDPALRRPEACERCPYAAMCGR